MKTVNTSQTTGVGSFLKATVASRSLPGTSSARGLAAFLALYSTLALAGAVFGKGYNQNSWWIDLSALPSVASAFLQLWLTGVLCVFAVRPSRTLVFRLACAVPVVLCALVAVANTVSVYAAAASGAVALGFPLPFSVFVVLGLVWIAASMLKFCTHPTLTTRSPSAAYSTSAIYATSPAQQNTIPASMVRSSCTTCPTSPAQLNSGARPTSLTHSIAQSPTNPPTHSKVRVFVVSAVTFVAVGVLFPLGQMHCFGTTDYRVPVDAAVVLGARVMPNGTPSPVLQDRLDTAIAFYQSGYTQLLVMSGGVDADGLSEAQAMRSYALECGVPAEAILLDEQGSNTRSTAQNTVATLRETLRETRPEAGTVRVAAVSNFYHLARIKMLYLAEGIDVVTVPSVALKDANYPLHNVLRELPAWWYYWLLNLVD